jgi:hypothetical protein
MTATFQLYSEVPEGRTQYVEKSENDPIVHSYSGIEFYVFKNLGKTVATWTNGMLDCEIQGDVSDEEMKAIINYIYSEE